jgi:hypothetical protein
MEQIIGAIEGAFNAFLSSPLVQLSGRAIVIYVVLLWLASAYWAYRDLQARTPNPIAPYLAAVIIVFFTPILFPFGLLLYKLVRPGETAAEANERALAQEVMLREMPIIEHCEHCQRRVEPEWIVCPSCRTQLRRTCPSCARKVELDWVVCAWCGHDPNIPGTMAVGAAVVAPERIARRRPIQGIDAGTPEPLPARAQAVVPEHLPARAPAVVPEPATLPDTVPIALPEPPPGAGADALPATEQVALAGGGSEVAVRPVRAARAARAAPSPRNSRR